ncbi:MULTISPECIES: GNAT family N-acetyltransferase [unclassified Rhodococcus (in: high G+C Gram-positive bacteria)]|uniref:GNAT family N-acetyltransferase n=1 Tax=unclassified Rhodococcus (in: high G+C Gram-positive bacteria) TaxID=192944 RepID=UPI0027E1CF36|nr:MULTISPECIES: GNAT family N-acetyltransferase [unclassified Rhodococcus (in: high G+C Gram-positive bacteria)]
MSAADGDSTQARVVLRTMPDDRLPEWVERSRGDYRADRVRAGDTLEQATDNAEQSFSAYFPDGRPAPHHQVYDVLDDETVVGSLWIGPQSIATTTDWWVWDIAIDERFRGRGLGRAAMLLAEDAVRENGGTVLGLNVFGFNTAARRLYESLGYDTASLRMQKVLREDAR